MDRLLTKLKKTENPSHHPASPEIPTKLSTNQDESKKKVARTSITPSKAKTVITINRHAIIDLLKEIAENTSVINQLSFKVVNQILSADDDTLSKVNSLQQISLYSDYI